MKKIKPKLDMDAVKKFPIKPIKIIKDKFPYDIIKEKPYV